MPLWEDAVGNLTDDGNANKYDYDAFGRMIRIKDRTTPFATISEYVYNGLGHRISWRYDANADSVTNSSDPWYHFAYDESWRVVALYRGADTSPKEIFVNHQPGSNGVRGAPGIAAGLDAVILRDKDANSVWTSASDVTREERVYYCQNWRGDVVALLGASAGDFGVIRERVTYSTYGVPQGLPPGDLDNDADADAADEALWNTLSAGGYDVRADLDLDGDMDITDEGFITGAVNQGFAMGRGVFTRDNGLAYAVGNRKGYAGYEHDGVSHTMCHVRNRVLLTELGRWMTVIQRPTTSRKLYSSETTISLNRAPPRECEPDADTLDFLAPFYQELDQVCGPNMRPNFACADNCPPGTGGYVEYPFFGGPTTITICTNNPPSSPERLKQTYAHEVLHAIQNCRCPRGPIQGCYTQICREHDAYTRSGQPMIPVSGSEPGIPTECAYTCASVYDIACGDCQSACERIVSEGKCSKGCFKSPSTPGTRPNSGDSPYPS